MKLKDHQSFHLFLAASSSDVKGVLAGRVELNASKASSRSIGLCFTSLWYKWFCFGTGPRP